MQQRERLLLTITHDIKAPAASIAGFIDLLSEYVDRPKAVGYLQSISGSANHLLQLVSALLDYHKLESGKAERHGVSFQPTALVSECVAQMQPLAMAKQLRLATDINVAEDMFCRSDAFRIKQIVNNLVSNAIKYTDEGEVRVGITVLNGWMTLSVSDTGCGMTPEELQSVFNAFTRLPGAQGKEGVGLGLTITREIVTLLGGRIKVASTKGKGTTFRVCLPVKVVANQGIHSGGALVSSAPTKMFFSSLCEYCCFVGAPPGCCIGALLALASGESRAETSAPPEETTAPPNEQERERLTKQLIEKLKEILCDIY